MMTRADAVAKAIHWAEVAEAREGPARYEREWSAAARDMARTWVAIAGLLPETDAEAPAPVAIRYTNHRGETTVRRVVPLRIWHGSTEWHPEAQWLMDALDVDKGAERSFALRNVLAFDAHDSATTN
jgi:hypothetical protein